LTALTLAIPLQKATVVTPILEANNVSQNIHFCQTPYSGSSNHRHILRLRKIKRTPWPHYTLALMMLTCLSPFACSFCFLCCDLIRLGPRVAWDYWRYVPVAEINKWLYRTWEIVLRYGLIYVDDGRIYLEVTRTKAWVVWRDVALSCGAAGKTSSRWNIWSCGTDTYIYIYIYILPQERDTLLSSGTTWRIEGKGLCFVRCTTTIRLTFHHHGKHIIKDVNRERET
jgi:hypothetical protein